MLTRSKLSSTESETSEALIKTEISNEEFMTIINKERNYWKSKQSIIMMNSQRSGTEKNSLIEEGKK